MPCHVCHAAGQKYMSLIHIETRPKWSSFCRRHFQMHVLERKHIYLILIPVKFLRLQLTINHHWLRKQLCANPQPDLIIVAYCQLDTWKKLQRNLNKNIKIFIQETAYDYVFCEMSSILFRPRCVNSCHDDVIKWKHFPHDWPFVRGIHRSPVNSPHKGQWRGALMFSLICAWINRWVNNREAGDLRRHRAHYDVIVMRPRCVNSCVYLIHIATEPCDMMQRNGGAVTKTFEWSLLRNFSSTFVSKTKRTDDALSCKISPSLGAAGLVAKIPSDFDRRLESSTIPSTAPVKFRSDWKNQRGWQISKRLRKKC